MAEEMRNVVLPEGAKVTHNGIDYYGPRTIPLPKADAEWLAQSVINARMETIKTAPSRRPREEVTAEKKEIQDGGDAE